VTKPIGQEELLARVRTFLRRSCTAAKTTEMKIQIGDLCIDLEARRVFISIYPKIMPGGKFLEFSDRCFLEVF